VSHAALDWTGDSVPSLGRTLGSVGALHEAGGGSAPPVTSRLIKLMSAVRRERQALFPGALGTDSCWEVLLQLYSAHLDQHRINIGKLTRRSGLPATTVLRTLETLADAGLSARARDPLDRRAVMVELTEAGATQMQMFFARSGPLAVLL